MIARLEAAFAEDQPSLLDEAEAALRALPTDPEVLLLAALAALVVRRPERAQAFLKRFAKRFVAGKPVTLLGALALAQQGQIARAWHLLESEDLTDDAAAAPGKRETLYVHVSRRERDHALDPRTRRFVVEAGASAFDEEA